MHVNYFYKGNGNLSSFRNTIKFGGGSMNLTSYPGSSDGGLTFRNGNMTARFNNKGQCIGTAMKSGKYTTYFGKNGGVVSSLTSFK